MISEAWLDKADALIGLAWIPVRATREELQIKLATALREAHEQGYRSGWNDHYANAEDKHG